MSFSRHQRSINPVGFLNRGPGAWLLGPRPLTVSMSRSRLFLGGSLSSGARLRFTGCAQNALEWSCRSKFSQRTANRVLTVCVSLGGKRSFPSGCFIPYSFLGCRRCPFGGILCCSCIRSICSPCAHGLGRASPRDPYAWIYQPPRSILIGVHSSRYGTLHRWGGIWTSGGNQKQRTGYPEFRPDSKRSSPG